MMSSRTRRWRTVTQDRCRGRVEEPNGEGGGGRALPHRDGVEERPVEPGIASGHERPDVIDRHLARQDGRALSFSSSDAARRPCSAAVDVALTYEGADPVGQLLRCAAPESDAAFRRPLLDPAHHLAFPRGTDLAHLAACLETTRPSASPPAAPLAVFVERVDEGEAVARGDDPDEIGEDGPSCFQRARPAGSATITSVPPPKNGVVPTRSSDPAMRSEASSTCPGIAAYPPAFHPLAGRRLHALPRAHRRPGRARSRRRPSNSRGDGGSVPSLACPPDGVCRPRESTDLVGTDAGGRADVLLEPLERAGGRARAWRGPTALPTRLAACPRPRDGVVPSAANRSAIVTESLVAALVGIGDDPLLTRRERRPPAVPRPRLPGGSPDGSRPAARVRAWPFRVSQSAPPSPWGSPVGGSSRGSALSTSCSRPAASTSRRSTGDPAGDDSCGEPAAISATPANGGGARAGDPGPGAVGPPPPGRARTSARSYRRSAFAAVPTAWRRQRRPAMAPAVAERAPEQRGGRRPARQVRALVGCAVVVGPGALGTRDPAGRLERDLDGAVAIRPQDRRTMLGETFEGRRRGMAVRIPEAGRRRWRFEGATASRKASVDDVRLP